MLIAAAVAPADSALVNLVRDKHNRKQRCSPCGCCCRHSCSLPGCGGTEPRAAAPRAAWGGCGQRAGGGPGPRSLGGHGPVVLWRAACWVCRGLALQGSRAEQWDRELAARTTAAR